MSNIKSAIESIVSSSKESLESRDPVTRNAITKGTAKEHLDKYSDFSVRLRCNDNELRQIFEAEEFDPSNIELTGDLGELSKSLHDRIIKAIVESVSTVISDNRAYFSSDPVVAIEEVKKYIDMMKDDIISTISDNEEYEQDVENNRKVIKICEEALKDIPTD